MVKTHIFKTHVRIKDFKIKKKSFPTVYTKINFIWIIDQSIKGKTKILKHTISLQYLGVLQTF